MTCPGRSTTDGTPSRPGSECCPQSAAGSFTAWPVGEHDLTETAKDIDTSKTAVYVLSGDYDWSATPDKCRALADAIPGAKYVRTANLGHFPMGEDPERFKSYVGPVLAEIAGGTA
jgi:pimeloyl-ACP methyl ester carboxylesterase